MNHMNHFLWTRRRFLRPAGTVTALKLLYSMRAMHMSMRKKTDKFPIP